MQISKRTLKIAGIVVAAVVVILIALPLFINVNSFRPKIESEVTNALGRPVTLGDLSLSLFGGKVGVENVSIADDPAFSKSPFITAKSLEVGVELMPLIFSKQLNVTGIVLDEPQITLLKGPNGTWNFSSLGGTSKNNPAESAKAGASQSLSIARLEIKDGKLAVGKANSTSKPQLYDKLNTEVKDFSLTSQFPFELTVNLPGGGNASLSGKVGPINPQDSAKTPFDASIKVKNLDLAASGFIDPASGIGGSANIEGTLNSTGSSGQGGGRTHLRKAQAFAQGVTGPESGDHQIRNRPGPRPRGRHHHPRGHRIRQSCCPPHGQFSDSG